MGIHLDWDVESDAGHESVEEDAAAIAARQKRTVQLKRILLTALIIVGLIGAVAAGRIWQVQHQKRAALESVVRGEALALRIGDLNKFMGLQGPAADWRNEQKRRFRKLQGFDKSITVTDQIVGLEMSQDEARARVQVMVNGEPGEAVWLYSYTDKGWRHVGTEAEPWSPSTRISDADWLKLTYYPVHAQRAKELETLITGWWSQASAAAQLETAPPLEAVLNEETDTLRWDNDSRTRLIVPAPRSGSVSDETLDPELKTALAHYLAARWASWGMGDVSIFQYDQWVLTESTAWMLQQYSPDTPGSPVLNPLEEAFGSGLVPALFKEMQADGTTRGVALQRAMIDTAPADLEGSALNSYLSNYLRAEFALSNWETHVAETGGSGGLGPRSDYVFSDPERRARSDSIYPMYLAIGYIEPGSVEVLETKYANEILWVRTRMIIHQRFGEVSQVDQETEVYIPFRMVDGMWFRTRPLESEWGAQYAVKESKITLRYHELDRPYVDGLLRELNDMYLQVASDLAIDDPPPITISIEPNPTDLTVFTDSGVPSQVNINSTYTVCCPVDLSNPSDLLRQSAGRILISFIMSTHSPMQSYDRPGAMVWWSLSEWEAEHVGLHIIMYPQGSRDTPFKSTTLPTSLPDLWSQPLQFFTPQDYLDMTGSMVGVKAMMDVLVERKGIGVLPKLIENFPTEPNPTLTPGQEMERWLVTSTGLGISDIEPEWRERFRERLDELASDPAN